MTSVTAMVLGAALTPAAAHEGHSHDDEEAAAAGPFRALIFSETAGFVHDSVQAARDVWDDLADENGFEVVQAQDSSLFTDAGLAEFDVIVLANASGDFWNASEEAAFERYVRNGGGVLAVHNPLDSEQGNAFYRNLIGTEFTAHSAANTPGAAVVTDHRHPATAELPGRWNRNEEWYGFTKTVRGDKHVVVSMDPTSVPANTPGRMPIDHPVSWCSDYEGGRTFVTSVGHSIASYSEPLVRKHLLGAAQYAAGVAEGDCKPTDWGNYDKVPLDTNTSAPWGIALAPDGRVFFTELVRGQVRIYDPEQQRTVTAATIPVYGGGENGLLGLALDPDFETNHYIYVYYSPADAPIGPGNVSHNQLSRFTMNGNTMDLESEVEMLEVPATRAPGANDIGHTGGTMRFDGNGDLWMSIGDDVNPFESSGYTPIDERPNRQHFDAQGTAANSNDLRGKLLRIHPEDDGTYSIPAGNMFDESGPDAAKTRPEIYAMGFRNPFRFSVNTDGTVYLADYGPDAGSPNANRGPEGYVEWQIISEPGNYGWPYCHANNIAYNDYNFATGTPGPKFDCANPVNTSPNNTGLTALPPSIPADVYYSYAASPTFPQLGSGSGSPMAGPAYDFDPDLDSDRKWPEYFDGTPLFFEWGRNYIAEFRLAREGEMGQNGGPVQTFNRVLSDRNFLSPVDLQFGPDGALYVLEWGGGYGRDNPNSGLYRVDYSPDGRAPTAKASAKVTSGQAPLTVEFSSEGTVDADGDEFDLAWDFGDGTTSTEANPTHTYTEIGNFEARLTVTERTAVAKVGTATVDIVVGNTAPQVDILGPPNGGFFEWGDTLPWKVRVTDEDDVQVDCGDVIVQPAMGHDDHAHPTTAVNACEGETETFLDEGHAEANAFWVIDARYTDAGGEGGSNPITSSATSLYRPKRFQAQYWTEQNGVALENNPAAEQGTYVGAIQNTDWIKYGDMNFRGIDSLRFGVSAGPDGGGFLDVRLGSPTGQLLGTVDVPSTSAWFNFYDAPLSVADAPAGTHDVYLVFRTAPGKPYAMILDTFEAVGKGVGYDATPEVPVVRTDDTTRGNWIGTYGQLGYTIPNVGTVLPEGVSVNLGAGAGNSYTWPSNQSAAGALQVPSQTTTLPATPSGNRLPTTWFHSTGYDVDVTIPADTSYDVSFYAYAHDGARSESLKLVKGDGTQIAPVRTVADNGNGRWVTYRVDSSFKAELRKLTGPNAVLSGVFFDEVEVPGEPDTPDTDKPTVTGQTLPMLPGPTGWFQQSPVEVVVDSDDGQGSGIEKTEIKIGSQPWTTYTGPTAIDRQGETTVKYRAIDGAGNQSETGSLTVKLDSDAPAITADITPAAPRETGWFAGPVTVDLTGTDAAPGSGVATVRYAVNGSGWVTGNQVVVSEPGVSVVQYQAIDAAGNESEIGELTVKVDGVAPTVAAVFSPNLAADGSVSPPVTVQLNGTDAGSGLSSVEYRLDGGGWTTYGSPIVVSAAGPHTLDHRATDLAGNRSLERRVSFTVSAAPASDKADTTVKVKAPKKARAGAKVTLKVAVVESSASVPTGRVLVRLKGKVAGRGTLRRDGRVKITLRKKLKAGKHKLTVTYVGDDTFNSSRTRVRITVRPRR